MRCQLRFVALGDSTTFGVGDPVRRGWAALLADEFAEPYARMALAELGARRDPLRDEVVA